LKHRSHFSQLQLICDDAKSRTEVRADNGERRYRRNRYQCGDQRIFYRGNATPIVQQSLEHAHAKTSWERLQVKS
jgi:hypothetical protein